MKDVRWQQRFEHFKKAFAEFESACQKKSYSKLERSGLIQTFEFTFELAWKTLQDLLLSRGYEGAVGPRPVIEQAFKDGVIHDGEVWMKMIASRNLAAQSYNEEVAEGIAIVAKNSYFPLFGALIAELTIEPQM